VCAGERLLSFGRNWFLHGRVFDLLPALRCLEGSVFKLFLTLLLFLASKFHTGVTQVRGHCVTPGVCRVRARGLLMTLGVSRAVEKISPSNVSAGHRPWHDPTLRLCLYILDSMCLHKHGAIGCNVCPAGFQSCRSPILPWYSPIPPSLYVYKLYL
jgi:hypothetical protein